LLKEVPVPWYQLIYQADISELNNCFIKTSKVTYQEIFIGTAQTCVFICTVNISAYSPNEA